MTDCKEFWENHERFCKKLFKTLKKQYTILKKKIFYLEKLLEFCDILLNFSIVIYANFRKIWSISVIIVNIIICKGNMF